MEQEAGSALKWVVAVVGLSLVVLLSAPAALEALGQSVRLDRSEPELPEVDDTDVEALQPVEDGMAVPEVDFLAVDRVALDLDAERVTISGFNQAMVLAFPLIEGDEACVATVELEMSLVDTNGEGHLGVHPSGVFTPLQIGEGDGVIPLLTPGPAALALTDGSLGRLRWDVTDLYRTWVQGAAFGDITIPGGVPFTVAIRATEDDGDSFTFATSEAEEQQAPAIVWTGSEECA